MSIEAEWENNVGEGWWPICVQLHLELLTLDPDYRIAQVKEKFGGLRFYLEAGTAAMWHAVSDAECRAEVTCEVCGKPGTNEPVQGWYSTLCAVDRRAYVLACKARSATDSVSGKAAQ